MSEIESGMICDCFLSPLTKEEGKGPLDAFPRLPQDKRGNAHPCRSRTINLRHSRLVFRGQMEPVLLHEELGCGKRRDNNRSGLEREELTTTLQTFLHLHA